MGLWYGIHNSKSAIFYKNYINYDPISYEYLHWVKRYSKITRDILFFLSLVLGLEIKTNVDISRFLRMRDVLSVMMGSIIMHFEMTLDCGNMAHPSFWDSKSTETDTHVSRFVRIGNISVHGVEYSKYVKYNDESWV